ncbi:phosphoserine phosphatase [Stella humosa]|uniref:Phosphoserine phosphatase n=1 Tax=Stella humosa TaxID=94 RepID=A0A3N1KRY1_9PROT|nr:phosphoserine phosphatase SerB [Stella humosa]ROP81150.1 phosphoserine phosphatase [Stella humosa]BBK32495.1 phosphoserine phosphatase SerB [Stella humosa]
MTHVITLVAGAEEGPLAAGAVSAAMAAIAAAGGAIGQAVWLAPARACDLPFAAPHPEACHAAAMAALAGTAIDVLAVPMAGRRKRLLVTDMEATVIENELLDDMAAMVGLEVEVGAVTRRAMAGEIDFAQALRDRVRLFAGQPRALLDRAAAGIRPMPGAAILVATMRGAGAATALVSGGFLVFVDRVGRLLGFQSVHGNVLGMDGDRLSGDIPSLPVTAAGKRDVLLRLAAEQGLDLEATMAIGDGANDIPMLAAAGLGIGFHPKPVVARAVANRIVHGDLTAALFAQGYRADELIGG